MKIRKLIFSAKLEQIETNNQNIFIFHCNPNAAQWRFLKNFLYSYDYLAKEKLTHSSSSSLLGSSLNKSTNSTNSSIIFADLPREKLDSSEKGLRGYTFFSFKQRLAQHLPDKYAASSHRFYKKSILANSRPFLGVSSVEDYFEIKRKGAKRNLHKRRPLAPLLSQASKSVKKNFTTKGCLFFFETYSNTLFESHQKSLAAMELVKKIESLEFNASRLLFLCGQMKSTVVNHIDLKQASILNISATYEQFFFSMHLISIDLSFCFHHKIDEFLCIQKKRTCK